MDQSALKNMQSAALKHALLNAVSFSGKCSASAVMGKLLAEIPELKGAMREVGKEVSAAVSRVNSMTKEEQKKALYSEYADFVNEREEALQLKRDRDASGVRELPALPGDTSRVVMRMAPFPSGPLHIGNARMAVLNDEYVKRYKGELVLFFDDTVGTESGTVETPAGTREVASKSILPEAYSLIPESLKWLGVTWHKEFFKSDRLEVFYEHAKKLIETEKAYVCTCDGALFRSEYKAKGRDCPCRSLPVSEHLVRWGKMLDGTYPTGGAVVRLKTGMDNKNPALRDHVIMRISEKEHPKVGRKYRVWPLLEFSWGIDDHLIGSTHILRGADLVKEDWIEEFVWDFFGWKHAEFLHYGKFRIEEGTISKSKSKDLIEKGTYAGWSDPRTWSLQSLKRRGIRPEAVRKFLLSFGMSIVDVSVPPEVLYGMNRELIDSVAKRYFFVANPARLKVDFGGTAKVAFHPDSPSFGEREYFVADGGSVLVEESDLGLFENGPVRLKGLGTYSLKGGVLVRQPEDGAENTIHFLPEQGAIKASVLLPDGERKDGFVWKNALSIKEGDLLQFERFGFCRCDRPVGSSGEWPEFWMAHK